MSNFLLVELEPNLARYGTTHNAAFLSVQHVNGVRCVVDLAAISEATLKTFLMPDEERAKWQTPPKRRSARAGRR